MPPKPTYFGSDGKPCEVPEVPYSDEEKKYRTSVLIPKLVSMGEDHNRSFPELDDMSYPQWYDANRKKDLSYIPPKKNRQDVRVVTGTTREKDTTILTALLNMNLEPSITAFDTDDLIVNELGENISDLVVKSREIEDYDSKRSLFYREFVSQGDIFVEELYVEDFRPMPLHKLNWDPTKDGVSDFSFKERLQKLNSGCTSRQVNGKKIYLGNIRTEYVQHQDAVAILNIYSREKAQSMYGAWERWKYVPYAIDTVSSWDDSGIYKDWNLVQMNNRNQVAEIKVYLPFENRYMILLNGVMMLPINYPLTAISPSGEVPMAQGKFEPITNFAYSKGQPSKTRMDQEIIDETLKMMVLRNRQSYNPSLGTAGRKVISSSIYTAGKVNYDLPKDSVYPLFPDAAQGVTAPQFSFYQTIKDEINEKSTSPNFSGDEGKPGQTATETIEMKNQAMMKLGLNLDGITNFERRMTWNRIYNVLQHWTDEEAEEIKDGIRTISMETTVGNGDRGIKMFRFTQDEYPSVADQEMEEDQLSKEYGRPVRVTYLDPHMLRTIPWRFFITIKPTPKGNDKLSQLMFEGMIAQGFELFGAEAFQLDYVKQRWSILHNEDFGKLFVKQSAADMLMKLQQGNTAGMPIKSPTSMQPPAMPGLQQPGPAKAAMTQ